MAMRVLMLSKALVTGVYQKKLEELARLPEVELLAVVPPRWVESRVGALDLDRRFTEGYRLVVEPMRLNGHHHLHWYPGLSRRMREFRPDIVHIDEEPYNLVAAHATRLARRAGARALFFTWQNLDRNYPPPFRWFERYCYRQSSAAIAGNADAVPILRRKGFRGRVDVIPQFGVDPEIYRPLPRSAAARGLTIAYYGRLVPEKGVDTLLDALALVPPPAAAVIVGSGDARPALEEQATRLGITDRVTFRGPIPAVEIPAFLAGVDVVVVPSRTRPNWKEQFGRVIVEAMACQVPVIGSDSGEIPHVIGDAGLIVPEGDAPALAAAIRRVTGDRDLACRLARAGRQRVLAQYTQQRVAEATYKLYRDIIARPGQLPAE